MTKNKTDFWANATMSPSGCLEWQGVMETSGYGKFNIGRTRHYAHRRAWELTNGPIPDGLFVLHRCDNPICINPQHLFLGTHQDNMADCRAKGRQARGESQGAAKLTDAAVLALREEYAGGLSSLPTLSVKYGVHDSQILDIVRGRKWKHVGGPISLVAPAKHWRRGSGHPIAKLTEDAVRTIRSERAAGTLGVELARRFGVTPALISLIAKRKSWAWVA